MGRVGRDPDPLAELVIPNPVAAAASLMTAAFGAGLAMSNATVEDLTVSKFVLFAGGIAVSLVAIAAFLKATGRGLSWSIRAADGMEKLMGDPKATPPIPSLPDQVAVVKEDVAEVRKDVAALVAGHEQLVAGQHRIQRLVEELLGDNKGTTPPEQPLEPLT